jgi:hypothetical protein
MKSIEYRHPAKAGVQGQPAMAVKGSSATTVCALALDSRFRGNDEENDTIERIQFISISL